MVSEKIPGSSVWCASVVQLLERLRQKALEFEANLDNVARPCSRIRKDRAKTESAVVQCLPGKPEALGSVTSAAESKPERGLSSVPI